MLDTSKDCFLEARSVFALMLYNEGMNGEHKEEDYHHPKDVKTHPRYEPFHWWRGPSTKLEYKFIVVSFLLVAHDPVTPILPFHKLPSCDLVTLLSSLFYVHARYFVVKFSFVYTSHFLVLSPLCLCWLLHCLISLLSLGSLDSWVI